MELITDSLKEIEERKKIKILYACETGSRAWGFPSPDSDYDVRFIYLHEVQWYLSLGQKKDTIEYMNGDLDITGWDLRKCLTLLKKSNAPLIERFQSPIVYYEAKEFKADFMVMIENYYSPTAVFYHHYALASKFWEEIKAASQFKLKSWFYLVRSLLSCYWIVNDRSILPMNIEGLMKYVNEDAKNNLLEMIELKKNVSEKYFHPVNPELYDWVLGLFSLLESRKNGLGVSRTDMSLINEFFIKKLYGKTDN